MTSRIIYGDEERLLPWAKDRIGLLEFRRDAHTIGLEKDGIIVAVAVYDTFSEVECNAHLASDGSKHWMNREFLVCGFAYPFIQCGFTSMTGVVPADNENAMKLNRHLGWVDVGVRHKALPGGGDIMVMEMLRENCRWIPEEHRR